MVRSEQLGPDTVAVSRAFDQTLVTPADLRAALPVDPSVVGGGADQLKVVFGRVAPWDREEMAEWLAVIFPELSEPLAVAQVLTEWDTDQTVMAVFPGRAWNLFRLRVAVPVTDDGGMTEVWLYGTVTVIGRALVVCWHEGKDQILALAPKIDAMARRGQYAGEQTVQSVADLASAYAREAARALRDCAQEGIKTIDDWETELFEQWGRRSANDERSLSISMLGSIRAGAFVLRQDTDRLMRQINRGQFRAQWSNEALDPVDRSVDRELELCHQAIARLRSDVSDSFGAATTVAIVRQLEASQVQQERAARFEGTVTRLTAFLLVPALVAAAFGANVELPGSGWRRTAIMLLAMVIGALLTFVALRRREPASPAGSKSDEL